MGTAIRRRAREVANERPGSALGRLAIERQVLGEVVTELAEVKERLHREMDPIEGALVEPKKASVAAHYRLVSEEERQRIKEFVDAVLAEHPDELKVTPGKMVYGIRPRKTTSADYTLQTTQEVERFLDTLAR